MTVTSLLIEPTLNDITQLPGLVLLEFGAVWCGYCQAAQPLIALALAQYPHIQHIKIEDGKGKRLGRLYSVKLWPTLILLSDGLEQRRIVRPSHSDPIRQLLGG